jgi:predicted nucleic acid-binding protein
MDVTIDTSAVLAVVTGEVGRQGAIAATTGHSLVAPASLHWEVGNALSAMLKRQRITLAQANACLVAYRKIPIKLLSVDLKQALAVVNKQRIYAYDAYMLVCAQQSGSPLLTFDDALKVHAEALGVEVLEV